MFASCSTPRRVAARIPVPSTTQTRHASLIRRPRRPYTFTQLITLSDGSTFTHRTTSPQPVYRSTKDTKNVPLWNPSSLKLLNVEEDEAGRLRRFRRRFGRGYDAETMNAEEQTSTDEQKLETQQEEESLMDLIAGYGIAEEKKGDAAGVREEAKRSGKGKGGQK